MILLALSFRRTVRLKITYLNTPVLNKSGLGSHQKWYLYKNCSATQNPKKRGTSVITKSVKQIFDCVPYLKLYRYIILRENYY